MMKAVSRDVPGWQTPLPTSHSSTDEPERQLGPGQTPSEASAVLFRLQVWKSDMRGLGYCVPAMAGVALRDPFPKVWPRFAIICIMLRAIFFLGFLSLAKSPETWQKCSPDEVRD